MAGLRAGHPAGERLRAISRFRPQTRAGWVAGSSPAMVRGWNCGRARASPHYADGFGRRVAFPHSTSPNAGRWIRCTRISADVGSGGGIARKCTLLHRNCTEIFLRASYKNPRKSWKNRHAKPLFRGEGGYGGFPPTDSLRQPPKSRLPMLCSPRENLRSSGGNDEPAFQSSTQLAALAARRHGLARGPRRRGASPLDCGGGRRARARNRLPPPFQSALSGECGGGQSRRRGRCRRAELGTLLFARRHGQSRHRQSGDLAADRLCRAHRAFPARHADPPHQRIWRRIGARSSHALCAARLCAAARRRCGAEGNRLRLRHAENDRRRIRHQLRRQISERPRLRAGVRGAEPAQSHRLFPSRWRPPAARASFPICRWKRTSSRFPTTRRAR